MKSTKVKWQDMKQGKKYFFESKGGLFKGYGVVNRLDSDKVWFLNQPLDNLHDGDVAFITNLPFPERYNFYSCHDDFEMMFNQEYNGKIYALMKFKGGVYCPAAIRLTDGSGCNSVTITEFHDIPDEPEYFEYKGKKYLASDVEARFAELKPVETE